MALDTIPKQEGGKLKAVASGTLPSGKPVIVNSDGTVSVAAETSGTEAVGTEVQFDAGNLSLSGSSSTFDSTNEKIVIVYSDIANSYYGTAIVGTVNGSSITFGTEVVFASVTTLDPSACFDTANGKVVVAYSDNTDLEKDGMAIVGTVSGTTISFGTPVQFDAARSDTPFAIYDSTNDKVVIAYESQNATAKAVVGTVSGTSISFGAASQFNASATTAISGEHDTSSGKTVITYSDSGNSARGTCVVATVSGTSISFGSEVVFETGGVARSTTGTVYDAVNNKTVISFSDQGDTENAKAIVGTVSGTSISFGTAVTWQTGATQRNTAVYHAAAGKVIVLAEDENDSGKAKYAVGTVSGTSISFTTAADFTSVGHTSLAPTYDSSNDIAVVAYKKDSDSSGNAATLQVDYPATNLTSENYIGMSGGVIKTFSQSEALGTESTFETGEFYSSASGYHVAEKKTLLMFQDASDSNKIKGRLVTATGTTLSYGSIVEVTGQVGGVGAVVYDSANEKLVVIFRGNTNYATAVVATISGSSLTFGTPVVFNSAASGGSSIYGAYDSTSGKIVVSYAGSGAGTGNLKVGTVSGTSITFGSATSLGVGVYETVLAYDPVNDKTIVGSYTSDTSDGKAWVGTVSGTSISVGSPTTFNTNIAGVYGIFHDAPSGKVGFIVQTGAGPGEAYVGTVSGTSISFGSGVQFQSGITQGFSGYDSRVNKFTVACRSITSPYPGLMRVGTISGDTFSFASAVTFNSGETAPLSVGFDSDQGTSIIAFSDGGDSNIAKAIGFQAAGSYEVIGSVADGDNATVDIVGTVSSNQVSLTAGQQYYVQTDGTIGTTPADPSVLAGTAVSATKMVVKS